MPRSQMFGTVRYRGETGLQRCMALTFDDGPHPAITPVILDCLGEHNMKATFFVVGRHAAEHSQLIERMHCEGHLVANHSYEHAHLGTMRGTEYWRREISQTDAVIQEIISCKPALFRPPMGFKTHHLMQAARELGHTVVTWTRRAYDGVGTTSENIIRRLSVVDAGDIILLHDGAVAPFRINHGVTERALRQLLPAWRAEQISVRPLDQLLGVRAYASETSQPVLASS